MAASNVAGSVALAHILGARELSVYYLAISAYALVWTFLNLGLGPVAAMRIAGSVRSGNTEQLAASVGVFLRLALMLGLVSCGIGLLTHAFAPPWLADRIFKADGVRVVGYAAILAIGPLFEAPRNICISALQGERRMLALSRVELGQEVARLGFVIMGALITGDALGPTLGLLAGTFFGALLAIDGYSRERRRKGSILPPLLTALRANGVGAGSAIKEGVKIGLVRNVHSLGVETIPSLLLGAFGNSVWVTYLRNAQRVGGMLRVLMLGINRTALPVFSQLAHVKDVPALRRSYWKVSSLSGVVTILGLAVALPLLPFAIRLLYPEEFWGPVYTLVLILSPGIAVASFSVANDVFYLVTQQMRVAVLISLGGLIVTTGVCATCVHFMPEIGAAVGLSIACLWSLVHMGYAGQWLRRHSSVEPLMESPTGSRPES